MRQQLHRLFSSQNMLLHTPRHRIENLRQADLSRVSTPRAFGGVLLARFDVRVDPVEQSELVTLLQDEVCTKVNSGPLSQEGGPLREVMIKYWLLKYWNKGGVPGSSYAFDSRHHETGAKRRKWSLSQKMVTK